MFNDLVKKKKYLKATWKYSIKEERDTIKKIKNENIVTDMNGVELKFGDIVVVHQDDGKREAIVVEVFPDSPTRLPGHWVDIADDEGVEGMMSYILERKGNEL